MIFASKNNAFLDKKRVPHGLTLIEIMFGLILASVIIVSIGKIFQSTSKQSLQQSQSGKSELDVKRFVTLMSFDIEKAGSDSTGKALNAYLYSDCSATGLDEEDLAVFEVRFLYGINPEPTNATCTEVIGEVGFLSYQAYDVNNDGVIDIEEGQDFVSAKPALRIESEDYVVYDLYDSDGDGLEDSIRRINVGDPLDDTDDVAIDVLKNVANFKIQYFGINAALDGGYGEITQVEYFNDMREVQVTLHMFYGQYDEGYINPEFEDDHPYYHFKTNKHVFRVGVNVIKPEI